MIAYLKSIHRQSTLLIYLVPFWDKCNILIVRNSPNRYLCNRLNICYVYNFIFLVIILSELVNKRLLLSLLSKFTYKKKKLCKITCAQLRPKTRIWMSREICYVKLGFQNLYAVEQFSSLFSIQFSLMQSNWAQTTFRKLQYFVTFLAKLNSGRV